MGVGSQIYDPKKMLGILLLVSGFFCWLPVQGQARAQELGQSVATNDCQTLRAQKNALVILVVTKFMSKGPEWVENNLEEPSLFLLKNYILIHEKIKFRCPQLPARRILAEQKRKAKLRGVQ